jgi:hypothetical protein
MTENNLNLTNNFTSIAAYLLGSYVGNVKEKQLTNEKTLELALKALGLLVEERSSEAMDDGYKAIKALEEALKQEPRNVTKDEHDILMKAVMRSGKVVSDGFLTPKVNMLNTLAKPVQQEQKRPQNCGTSYCSCIECVMEQEQGEPVAWRREFEGDVSDLGQWLYADEYEPKDESPNWQPLYTTPQQRTAEQSSRTLAWVGLTDEDKKSFWTADQMTQEEWDEFYQAVEAKLKEKNGF